MEVAPPPVMLKASVLADKLKSAIGEGVDVAIIMTTSGALLSTASNRTDFARSQECRMLAALTANIWRTYASTQKGMPSPIPSPAAPAVTNNTVLPSMHNTEQSELDFVMAELETNKLCCFGMGGRAVLALFAASSTELGLLKLKAASLQGELFDGIKLALRQDAVQKIDAFQ